MNLFQRFGSIIKEKNGNRLALVTALTALLVILIVFPAVLFINSYSKLKLLDQYIREFPSIVRDRESELDTRSDVYKEDVKARGELGTRIYREESTLAEAERLAYTRSMIRADSISLIDQNGTILNSTGIVMPSEQFADRIGKLEPGTPSFELYNAPDAQNKEGENSECKVLVMYPAEEEPGHSLVFEFSCQPLLELYNSLGGGTGLLERMLSGLEAYAFIQPDEGDTISYTFGGEFTDEQKERLKKEIPDILDKGGRFVSLGGDSSYKLTSVLNHPALAVMLPYPEWNSRVLLLVSLWGFVCTGFYCAVIITVFIIFSLLLFSVYVYQLGRQKSGREDTEEFKQALKRATRPGRLVLFGAIGCLSVMLLLLESRATVAYIGTTKGIALQSEITWQENQSKKTRGTYADIYRTRTEALAEFLTEHAEYRTRKDLQIFCDTLGAEYLMLFDENGQELISSNSYTGFSVGGAGANLSEEYRAVLLGYPSAVVGPEKDPYSGKQQIGAAVLLTQADGLADGFLLAVFDASDMNAELDGGSLENTVNTYAVTDGYKAALIDNETGLILAHTDQDMIGIDARFYIPEEAIGTDYAGFTESDGERVYISGVANAQKTLLFMVPNHTDTTAGWIIVLMLAVLFGILAVIYCPKICSLCAETRTEEGTRAARSSKAVDKNPLLIFGGGYIIFFTLLAAITFAAAYVMQWPAFTYVFGGLWSRGVHLFSLWAALFFLAVMLSAVLLFRMAIKGAEKRTNLRARTALKLVNSFVAYAAGILLVAVILHMFGVNTVALLASAGIVSIAVGMGAKDIVSDVVAGLFLIVEDSIHIGDEVSVGSWKGRVTDMGIRTTKIADEDQNVKILNNSHISDIVNMSRKGNSAPKAAEEPEKAGEAEGQQAGKNEKKN